MFYLQVNGGLCNRFRVIASADSIAKELGKKVTVIWPLDSGCNCKSEKLFTPSDRVTIISTKSRLYGTLRKLKCMLTGKVFNVVHWKDRFDAYEAISKHKNVFIKTCYKFWETDYPESIRLLPEITEKADGIISKDKNVVGVHIRRTDNVQSIECSPTELFVERMNEIVESEPDTLFYLATDSPEEERKLEELFPGKIILFGEKELSRNSEQGLIDAAVDFCCLSKCSQILGSDYSSFSGVASEMGGIPLSIIKKE